MGICNKVAGALAPIVLGAITLKDADTLKKALLLMTPVQKASALNGLAQRVILPYTVIVFVLILLALLVFRSGLPEIDTDHEDEAVTIANSDKTSILQFPHLLLGVAAMFLYVGVEVLSGDTIISYGASQGIAFTTAKFFTTCTLISMIIGYIFGIICIPKYFSQGKALLVSALVGVFFSLLALITTGYVSVLFIALLGLANSLMWPAIWPLAINGLGRFTKIGSSLLIMGIAGGAIIPLIYGKLADIFSPHYAYWLLVPCYLFIWYYALYNQKKSFNKQLSAQ
jgi:glucose/galactose transporter